MKKKPQTKLKEKINRKWKIFFELFNLSKKEKRLKEQLSENVKMLVAYINLVRNSSYAQAIITSLSLTGP